MTTLTVLLKTPWGQRSCSRFHDFAGPRRIGFSASALRRESGTLKPATLLTYWQAHGGIFDRRGRDAARPDPGSFDADGDSSLLS